MRVIKFFSAKGGQGVTTTAALYALKRKQDHPSESIVLRSDDTEDAFVALGLAAPQDPFCRRDIAHISAIGHLAPVPEWCDVLVVDGDQDEWDGEKRVFVSRLDFLSVRRTFGGNRNIRADGVLVIADEGRSLTPIDVALAIGVPLLGTLKVTVNLARTLDAGLLATRFPRTTDDLNIEPSDIGRGNASPT